MYKYTYEFAKEQFKKKGYTLLSKEYNGSQEKLNILCSNGHNSYMTLSSLIQGHGCPVCFKSNKHTIEFIANEFKKRNWVLLSTEYKDNKQKLKYICDKGHYNEIKYNNFYKYGCSICSKIKKYTIKDVKSEFEKVGYTLLSTEYKDNKQKLEYICDKDHKNIIKLNSLKTGHRCPTCYINNYTKEGHPSWKGGVTKLNLPLFDTYAHKIDFCEEVRRDPDNNNLLQIRCTNCNKWFTTTTSKVETRIISIYNSNKGSNRFYCSDECKSSCSIFNKQIYPKGFKVDRSREIQPELAAMVLERDSYECQRCGNKANLECHHYEGIEQNPIESADIDACVTLCKQCHKKAHKDKGCRQIDLTKKNLCKQIGVSL